MPLMASRTNCVILFNARLEMGAITYPMWAPEDPHLHGRLPAEREMFKEQQVAETELNAMLPSIPNKAFKGEL